MSRVVIASWCGSLIGGFLASESVLRAETATFTIDAARSIAVDDEFLAGLGQVPLEAEDAPDPMNHPASYIGAIHVKVEEPLDPTSRLLSGNVEFAEASDMGPPLSDQLVAVNVGQGLQGDFNNNGLVEQGDLDLVLLNWGQSATPPPGGWVRDLPVGTIDQEELDRVLLNWGNQTPPLAPAESVPEPYSLLLILLAPAPLIARLRW